MLIADICKQCAFPVDFLPHETLVLVQEISAEEGNEARGELQIDLGRGE